VRTQERFAQALAVLLADKTPPCPNKLGHILTNLVTGCHSLALKVTPGTLSLGEPDEKKLRL